MAEKLQFAERIKPDSNSPDDVLKSVTYLLRRHINGLYVNQSLMGRPLWISPNDSRAFVDDEGHVNLITVITKDPKDGGFHVMDETGHLGEKTIFSISAKE